MRQLTKVIGSVTRRPVTVEALPHITNDTYRLVGDITKIRALGDAPSMALTEGVKQLAQELG